MLLSNSTLLYRCWNQSLASSETILRQYRTIGPSKM